MTEAKKNLKKSRALTILVSWLEAVQIPFDLKDNHIAIGDKTVAIHEGDIQPQADICVKAADITAPLDKALQVFWVVTESSGFGRPQPVDRGGRRCTNCNHALTPEGQVCPQCQTDTPDKIRFTTSPELVAMRHSEFRKVANAPDEIYKNEDFQRIMKWYCIEFYRKNTRLCFDMGYDVGDLMTYAMVYLTNFWGKWRHLDADLKENAKMLCGYLNQRFYSDLLPALRRKSRSILVDEETIDLGNNVHHVVQYEKGEDATSHREPIKNDAEVEYETALETMEHQDLVDLLTSAIIRKGVKVDVRAEAIRLMTRHWVQCYVCTPFNFAKEISKFSHFELAQLLEGLAGSKTVRPAISEDARERLIIHDKNTCLKCRMASMPAEILCRRCNTMKPRENFGLRVMKRDPIHGLVLNVAPQPFCTKCRHHKTSGSKYSESMPGLNSSADSQQSLTPPNDISPKSL